MSFFSKNESVIRKVEKTLRRVDTCLNQASKFFEGTPRHKNSGLETLIPRRCIFPVSYQVTTLAVDTEKP